MCAARLPAGWADDRGDAGAGVRCVVGAPGAARRGSVALRVRRGARGRLGVAGTGPVREVRAGSRHPGKAGDSPGIAVRRYLLTVCCAVAPGSAGQAARGGGAWCIEGASRHGRPAPSLAPGCQRGARGSVERAGGALILYYAMEGLMRTFLAAVRATTPFIATSVMPRCAAEGAMTGWMVAGGTQAIDAACI